MRGPQFPSVCGTVEGRLSVQEGNPDAQGEASEFSARVAELSLARWLAASGGDRASAAV